MMKVECIYVVEVDKKEQLVEDNSIYSYSYFNILNENKELIEVFDYINVKGKVRFDIENGVTRIYPALGKEYLYYDTETHTLFDSYIGEEVWVWTQD